MPDWKTEIRNRLAGLSLPPEREAELVDELSQHLEDKYQELLQRGMSAVDAELLALRELSSHNLLAEELRRAEIPQPQPIPVGSQQATFFLGFGRDIRYSVRMFVKSPGFTAAAILTLALGIGANVAIFSVVNAVLLRSLAYPHSEQLVAVFDAQPRYGNAPMSYPEYADWRVKSQLFENLGAQISSVFTFTGAGDAEQVDILRVSSNFLDALGIQPLLGRNFHPQEEALASPRVAIITYAFWQTRFAGDPAILQRKLILSDNVFTIVGVLPRSYQPLRPGEVLIPFRLPDPYLRDRGLHFINIVGRLRPGLNVEEARQQIPPLVAQVEKDSSTDHGLAISSLKESLTQGSHAPILLACSAVAFVLLIGCVNVANLLLARAAGRHREMAVRIALGAGPWRLVRQLLTESVLLALLGGALGLLVARFALVGLLSSLGPRLPRATEVHMDGAVLLFAFGIAILVGILFGLAPARLLLRTSLIPSLSEGERAGATIGRRQRSVLVVSEVALAVVLLVGAGLVLRSLSRLLSVPKGFDSDHVLTFGVSLSSAKYQTPVQQTSFFSQFRDRLAALPGVDSVGFVNQLPLDGGNVDGGIDIAGRTFPKDSSPHADKRVASPGYFHSMHIPILRGREFSDGDVASAPHVAIINDAFARKYFPNEDPLGKSIAFNWDMDGYQQIVGVAGNVKHNSLALPDNAEVYVCYLQRPDNGFTFALRTKTDTAAMDSAVRSALQSLDPGLPLSKVAAYDDVVSRSVQDQRSSALLLGSFSALALVLTAIGIYGVLAYIVAQQTRELGVRIAMGAVQNDILRLVLTRCLKLVAAGAAIGILASLALTRLMSSFLFGITPTDPLTFASVTALLLLVGLVAGWIPAWQATRVDPLVVLRYE